MDGLNEGALGIAFGVINDFIKAYINFHWIWDMIETVQNKYTIDHSLLQYDFNLGLSGLEIPLMSNE